jgi:hypothetical protein
MTAHDRYLARHMTYPVVVTCRKCDEQWDDQYEEEYGQGWLQVREQCYRCGATGDDLQIGEMDELDIEERRLEARGEDF